MVTNIYFPLVPGRTLVYHSQTPEGLEVVSVTTLAPTFVIAGVECRQVRDVVTLAGELVEDTIDWYAQHQNGNVWYFGEVAKNYEDGVLDNLDGSWRTGKDGAKPGIQMLANPTPETAYRQEFLINEAEDIAEVEALNRTITVPYGTFTGCLQTEETTLLEPGARTFMYYAPGVGLVLEVNPDTGERVELVQIIN
jgi:hypothetical protein